MLPMGSIFLRVVGIMYVGTSVLYGLEMLILSLSTIELSGHMRDFNGGEKGG
jgi:hypothetical protein